MKLLTEQLKKQIPALYSTENIPKEDKVFTCKFFNPVGPGTWLVVEGEEQEGGDWLFFGLANIIEPEWGYFTLNELESVQCGYGLGIERDIHFENEPMEKFA